MVLTRLFSILLHLELLVAAFIRTLVHVVCRDEQFFASFLFFLFLFLLFSLEIWIIYGIPLLKSSMFLITTPVCCFSRAFAALSTVLDLKNYSPFAYWSVWGPSCQTTLP